MGLSVAMITLNEEKILERTLNSVAEFADEIVIVDSGSTDRRKVWGKIYISKVAWIWNAEK